VILVLSAVLVFPARKDYRVSLGLEESPVYAVPMVCEGCLA
jgi:hypothetical protein